MKTGAVSAIDAASLPCQDDGPALMHLWSGLSKEVDDAGEFVRSWADER